MWYAGGGARVDCAYGQWRQPAIVSPPLTLST